MKSSLLLPLLIIASGAILLAQQSLPPVDPPELVQAKADHVRAMYRAQIAPLTSYLQTLTSIRQQYVRESKLDAVTAIDLAIKNATAELDAANAGSNITVSGATQLQIELAVYGDLQRNRVADVTNYFKSAIASGKGTVSMYGWNMFPSADPAPGVHKGVRITYTVDGKRKSKDFKESQDAVLDLKKDLR
jgi:hypothetical protein